MRIATIFTAVLIATLLLSTSDVVAKDEIYRWVDENGVVHFGNRPDGHSDAEVVKIQKAPDNINQPDSEPETTEAGEAKPSYAQQQRDERAKKHKESAERKKEMLALCEKHRQVVEQLEPMTRVIVEQEDGTVIRMDDNDRLEKLRESRTIIAENCIQ